MSKSQKYINGLVSVVIPTYNHSSYIAATLESVLNQTYGNLQIIVSDDSSTDDTIDIVKSYAKLDSRIKLLSSETNKGIPSNFNKAFDAVEGEFVAFLGGDDLMLPSKIEKQKEFLSQNSDYVLVQSDMILFDSDTANKIKKLSDDGKIPTDPLEWPLKVDWHFENKYVGVLPSSCFARSEYYLSARYSEQLYLKHELLFTIECYCHDPKGKWGVIEEVLGKYRIHSNNFSKTTRANESIFMENFKLAALVKVKCPMLIERANEFEFFMAYKILLFKNYNNLKEKIIAENIFNKYASLVQKKTLFFGQILNRMHLLGAYSRINGLLKIFN